MHVASDSKASSPAKAHPVLVPRFPSYSSSKLSRHSINRRSSLRSPHASPCCCFVGPLQEAPRRHLTSSIQSEINSSGFEFQAPCYTALFFSHSLVRKRQIPTAQYNSKDSGRVTPEHSSPVVDRDSLSARYAHGRKYVNYTRTDTVRLFVPQSLEELKISCCALETDSDFDRSYPEGRWPH